MDDYTDFTRARATLNYLHNQLPAFCYGDEGVLKILRQFQSCADVVFIFNLDTCIQPLKSESLQGLPSEYEPEDQQSNSASHLGPLRDVLKTFDENRLWVLTAATGEAILKDFIERLSTHGFQNIFGAREFSIKRIFGADVCGRVISVKPLEMGERMRDFTHNHRAFKNRLVIVFDANPFNVRGINDLRGNANLQCVWINR